MKHKILTLKIKQIKRRYRLSLIEFNENKFIQK